MAESIESSTCNNDPDMLVAVLLCTHGQQLQSVDMK